MEQKLGIWIGKFESSGSTSKVTIIPNTKSLTNINLNDIFVASQGVKKTYSLTGDSHLMKNIEWGAVAYLAESRYGRNGTQITINSSNRTTGAGNYVSNVMQSTTGNIYGIYDMNGTTWEYVAGVLESMKKNGDNDNKDNYYDFTDSSIDKKYYDTYTTYNESRKIKGDNVYETSTDGMGMTGWHGGFSRFVISSRPVVVRSRRLSN